jgi:hypothetical protein
VTGSAPEAGASPGGVGGTAGRVTLRALPSLQETYRYAIPEGCAPLHASPLFYSNHAATHAQLFWLTLAAYLRLCFAARA